MMIQLLVLLMLLLLLYCCYCIPFAIVGHYNTVCAEIFAVLNFRGCITLRIFTDFIFAFVGQIKFTIFQFKMIELESCIHVFHVHYV